jgi:hypothetical protein
MSEISSQAALKPEDQLNEIKMQLEAQKKRYEKLKFKHSHVGEAMHDLRQSFQSSLNKLNSLDTRDVAVRELKQIIDRNLSLEALKIYLGTLGEITKVKSAGAREQEVLIIGFIAQVFGDRLIEDGSLKNIVKMLEVIREFYGDLSRPVHEAAASAFCDVYAYGMRKDNIELILGVFFDPLEIAMTSGVNVKAQQAASLSIFKWVQVLIEEGNTRLILPCYPRIVSLYIRLRTDFPDLISTLGVLIDSQGVNQILSEIHPILKKTMQYLNASGTGAYLSKIEACKLLSCLAKQLQGIADIVIEPFHNEVIFLLQQTKIDKLQSVQIAARQALADWKRLENIQKEIEYKKMEEDSVFDNEVIKSNGVYKDSSPSRMAPNNFKAIRELAKRNKKNTDNWGLSKPKFLEKKSGNYSVSPNQSREGFKKVKEEMFYPSLVIPKEGVSKNVMEIIHKKSLEQKGREEVYYDDETPEPQREVFVKHVNQRDNLTYLSNKIKETFKSMESAMDYGFGSIETRLQNLDTRMDTAYEKLHQFGAKPSVPSFIHPPKLETSAAFTQTQNNVEIQAVMSQTNLSSPVSNSSKKNLDALSQAWVEVLQWVNEGNLEEAYKKVLGTGDDIYLLRLMHKTGVCLKSISQDTSKVILHRLSMILNSNFLESLGIIWVQEALKERVYQRLHNEDKQLIYESIHRFSALPGEEGELASEILKQL